jgi:CheY-like chemotaxis protein
MTSVLVMDDSEVVRMTVTAVLEDSGYEVRAVGSLAELEVALAAGAPDLLVLDVQMPEMFGDDVAQVLRKVRNFDIPIVLFSDIDDAALAQRGREAGVDSWVAKRDGVGALLAKVEELVAP